LNKEEIRKQIENVMDNTEKFFKLVQDFENKYKLIPHQFLDNERFMTAYTTYKKIGSWRDNKKVKKKIEKAIKKFIKNEKK
jgi:inorganic pyrophosphatase